MRASMTVDISGLKKMARRFSDNGLREEFMRIPMEKGVAALVGQAIADNFAQQGPGWTPLKAETIRRSVAKKLRKSLADMSDEEILKHERAERAKGEKGAQYRMILQKTGLLKKTATIPGYSGSNKGANGRNIWKQEGTKLIWGTDLIYAGVHQNGYPKKNIPARPFLKLRSHWLREIQNYVIERMLRSIRNRILGGAE